VTSIFGIKDAFFAFFSITTTKFFSGFREKTLVHYNLHRKAMHLAFNVAKLVGRLLQEK